MLPLYHRHSQISALQEHRSLQCHKSMRVPQNKRTLKKYAVYRTLPYLSVTQHWQQGSLEMYVPA